MAGAGRMIALGEEEVWWERVGVLWDASGGMGCGWGLGCLAMQDGGVHGSFFGHFCWMDGGEGDEGGGG